MFSIFGILVTLFISSERVISGKGYIHTPKFYEIPKNHVHEIRQNFGELFWNHMRRSDIEPERVSSECYNELKSIESTPGSGKTWKEDCEYRR